MGDNGEIKLNQGEKLPKIEMVIVQEEGKPIQVGFPFLHDKLATYGFLKLAEKTLDAHYREQAESKIIKPDKELVLPEGHGN